MLISYDDHPYTSTEGTLRTLVPEDERLRPTTQEDSEDEAHAKEALATSSSECTDAKSPPSLRHLERKTSCPPLEELGTDTVHQRASFSPLVLVVFMTNFDPRTFSKPKETTDEDAKSSRPIFDNPQHPENA